MRRLRILETALLLASLLLAGVVWLSYHPDSEILRRAGHWPVIGPLAQELRRVYSPAPEPLPESAPSQEEVTGLVPPSPPPVEIDWSAIEAHPFEWFVTGTTVHEQPDEASRALFTLDNPARYALRERRGEWGRVRTGGRDGWILVNASTVHAEPPLGRAPTPVTAVDGRAPDEARLARALEALGPRARSLRLGPYPLYTDLPDGSFLSLLGRVAHRHEEGYRLRYRLPLQGQARAAVVIFSKDASYQQFQAGDARLSGLRASGHAGYGIVALSAAGASEDETVGTLIHELSHLLNRRAVGPSLPPWLDEGLAEDLAGLQVSADGRLREGTWRGERASSPLSIRWTGTLVDLKQIESHRAQEELIPLPELLALSWERFVRPEEHRLRYAHSALWIRFLLRSQGGLADPFRAFLGAVATGEPPTAESLRRHLGKDWEQLDQGFRAWIQEQAALRL